MRKWLGKVILISGLLLWLNPSLLNRLYLQDKLLEVVKEWQIILLVIGFLLLGDKKSTKSHR